MGKRGPVVMVSGHFRSEYKMCVSTSFLRPCRILLPRHCAQTLPAPVDIHAHIDIRPVTLPQFVLDGCTRGSFVCCPVLPFTEGLSSERQQADITQSLPGVTAVYCNNMDKVHYPKTKAVCSENVRRKNCHVHPQYSVY